MSKWEYGGFYKKYDMGGIIKIGTGELKVHNLFDPLPEFMYKADVIFSDPPCSRANINCFYTKADRTDYQEDYTPFAKRFFECIDEINPHTVFIEVFKANKEYFLNKCKERFEYIRVYNSTYYHKSNCKCWIIQASNVINKKYPLENIDEEDIIKWICANVDYKCIGDLCMGTGLVGYHAFKNGKNFVGTELNKKRLAILVDNISNS